MWRTPAPLTPLSRRLAAAPQPPPEPASLPPPLQWRAHPILQAPSQKVGLARPQRTSRCSWMVKSALCPASLSCSRARPLAAPLAPLAPPPLPQRQHQSATSVTCCLRPSPPRFAQIHTNAPNVLDSYSQFYLPNSFIVVFLGDLPSQCNAFQNPATLEVIIKITLPYSTLVTTAVVVNSHQE